MAVVVDEVAPAGVVWGIDVNEVEGAGVCYCQVTQGVAVVAFDDQIAPGWSAA
jgi:hypothetical protein